MKKLAGIVLVSVLLLLAGCGKTENRRPEGGGFESDIRDKSSNWKNQK